MIREELRDIGIDWDSFYESYDYDQAYDTFPCVFPTVRFQLENTHGLDALADAIRKENGCLPLYDDSGEYYDVPWYNFLIHLNGYNETHVDYQIEVEVEPANEVDDDLTWFAIDLTKSESRYIYDCLDKELRKYESNCEDELRKAADIYERDCGEKLTILERRTA